MTSTSTSMRALILDSYQSGQLRSAQVDKPSAKPGEVLVRIHASGVNPIDYKIRTGQAPYAMPELPAVLGTDLAGVIETVGEGVGNFKTGDEVYGLTGGVRGLQGSLAEFAAVDARLLALKPKNLSMREAAALPLVALTAWEGLIDRARVQPGQQVLVQGGAGGVGHLVVQLAKAHGAEVYATVRNNRADIVRSLGATPIDVGRTSVADFVAKYTEGKGFELIYDTIGGLVLDAAFEAVAHYGHIVSCAAFGTHSLAIGSLRCATLSGVFVLLPMLSGELRAHHGDILRQLTELVEAGRVKPIVDVRRFNLDSAMAAHALVEQGGASVKVVIDVAT
jgi:NADPH:quinone reductase